MTNLNNKLSENYKQHPAFRNERAPLEVRIEGVHRFNELYFLAKEIGSSLKWRGVRQLTCQVDECLARVFNELLQGAGDTDERYFIDELRHYCFDLTRDEMHWFFKRLPVTNLRGPAFKVIDDIRSYKNNKYYFGRIRSGSLTRLLRLSADVSAHLKNNASSGRLTREDLSVNSGPAVRSIVEILNEEFADNGTFDVLLSAHKQRFRVSGAALELSVAGASWWHDSILGTGSSPKTLYAHLDESVAFPKSIVYLSAVGEANGPTSCYPGMMEYLCLSPMQQIVGRVVGLVGSRKTSRLSEFYEKKYHQSMSCTKFRMHFMRLPEAVRFNSHFGWDVLPGSELEREMVDREKKLLGNEGEFIVFDGANLVHRGGLVQEGSRLALQIIFSARSLGERVRSKIRRAIR